MNKGAFKVLFGAVILAWAVGCGGNVTTSGGGDGGGGAGGDGGGGSGGTTNTGTTSGTTSTTITGGGGICDQLCAVGKAASCYDSPVSECVDGCNQQYQQVPDCKGEMDAAYQCAITKVPVGGCDLETLCPNEIAALSQCVNATGCNAGDCVGSETSCSCSGSCNGNSVAVDCDATATGATCTCTVNGDVAGTCEDVSLSCDFQGGCCAQFF